MMRAWKLALLYAAILINEFKSCLAVLLHEESLPQMSTHRVSSSNTINTPDTPDTTDTSDTTDTTGTTDTTDTQVSTSL